MFALLKPPKAEKKTFPTHVSLVFDNVRPFLKPKHLKHNRFCLWSCLPDSHMKPCTLRGLRQLLKTGGAENSLYLQCFLAVDKEARQGGVEKGGPTLPPLSRNVGGDFSVR